MLKFRRLYWVTEEISANGGSGVHGVYTSIPDLLKNGIQNGKAGKLRLSLVKLDCADGPLGVWEAPNFAGIEESLQEYVSTDEISADQCQTLVDNLKKIGSASA